MAHRRMFSTKITTSAPFLKMPMSSQALYFHLALNTDDDGIVEGFSIIRMLSASEDDLQILINKGFVKVLNEDLVMFITHWHEHNLIRADRKTDSIYKDLLLQIVSDVKLIEARDRTDNILRDKAQKESNLPDKFKNIMRDKFLGENCPICNITMLDKNTKPSIQHNIPISKGGKHIIDNISVICLSCNMSIKNSETGELNNKQVKDYWNEYLNEDSTRTARGQHKISKVKLSKVNLIEDNINIVIEHYCQKTGRNKTNDKDIIKNITQVLTIYTIDDCKKVIDFIIVDKWYKENGYDTLSSIFKPSKFSEKLERALVYKPNIAHKLKNISQQDFNTGGEF